MKVPKETLKQLIKENNLKTMADVQNTLKELFAETIQEMLNAEIEDSLGYAKHEVKNKKTSNSRNGYSSKTLTSEYGEVEIEIPRDRHGEFEPQIVKKHQTNVAGIEEQIIAMYSNCRLATSRII